MFKLLGKDFDSKNFCLQKYQRVALAARHYPGLISDAESSTEGILYLDLSSDEFKILDEYEGHEYERCLVSENIQTYLYIGSEKNILSEPWHPIHKD
jgi:hypothetical protein